MTRAEIIRLAAERDRRMQVFLAQSRGPVRNGNLLRQAVDRSLKIVLAREEGSKVARVDDALVSTLEAVTAALEQVGLEYAVTGSVASSLYGEPHATLDADLVVRADVKKALAFAAHLSNRFYAAEDMLAEAARNQSMANVIDNEQSMKVDLSFVRNDAFLNGSLNRRIQRTIGDHPSAFWFVTPEDVILMKLLWRRGSQSTKQWDDALGIVRVMQTRLDWGYLLETAERLGIKQDVTQLRDEGGI